MSGVSVIARSNESFTRDHAWSDGVLMLRRKGTRTFWVAAVIAVSMAFGDLVSAASVTTYTNAALFTDGLTDYWSNEFSGIASSGVRPNPSSFSGVTSGTYAYSATATGGLYGWAPGTPGPALTTLVADTNLVFNGFSPGVSAFGGRFWVADFFDGRLIAGQILTLTLTLSDSTTATATTTVSSTAAFLGLIVDPSLTIVSAKLSMPSDNRYTNAAGQVIVGVAVPEPATLALALIAAGAGWVRWRRLTAARIAG